MGDIELAWPLLTAHWTVLSHHESSLPDLPDVRSGHSQDQAGIICGGEDSTTSCVQWTDFNWVRTEQDLPLAGYHFTCLANILFVSY